MKWEHTSRVGSKLAPIGIHIKFDTTCLGDKLQLTLIAGGSPKVPQLRQALQHVGILNDIDILAEALVLALSVGDVQLRRSVEFDLKWVGEHASILRCVDKADEHLIVLLEDDVLP